MNSTESEVTESAVDDPIDEDDTIVQSVRYQITSYGADFPVDGIVSRLERSAIYIPRFQRKFVWTHTQASRFIESLLLGLPVPGIFLFRDPTTRKLMVVDGQQRLRSLQHFYRGTFGQRKFDLLGVSEDYQNKTYRSLSPEAKQDLDDSIIHATIFQQDEPSADRSSIYSIFERLNTGGSPLQPQEIRACVYRGRLNDLLSDLARNSHWKAVYHSTNTRKKDEEIILRFLALYYERSNYERPMKQFLNRFMEKYRDANDSDCERFRRSFETTIEVVDTILTPKSLRPKRALNVSVADAVLVGLAHRLERGPITETDALRTANKRVLQLLEEEELFTIGTTNKDRVERRIELACREYDLVQ